MYFERNYEPFLENPLDEISTATDLQLGIFRAVVKIIKDQLSPSLLLQILKTYAAKEKITLIALYISEGTIDMTFGYGDNSRTFHCKLRFPHENLKQYGFTRGSRYWDLWAKDYNFDEIHNLSTIGVSVTAEYLAQRYLECQLFCINGTPRKTPEQALQQLVEDVKNLPE